MNIKIHCYNKPGTNLTIEARYKIWESNILDNSLMEEAILLISVTSSCWDNSWESHT
jgi:hypothetical protein